MELNSDVAGLAAALVIRGPADFRRKEPRPSNIPLVMIGVALLWFGWPAFNAGSALRGTGTAATAFINTQLAAAGAMVTWPLVEYARTRKVTVMGVGSSAVAGMVAVTPACGEIDPTGALITGLVTGAFCAWAATLKYRLNVDDTLDVVGVHGAGGFVGLLMVGLFATRDVSGKEGLLCGVGLSLLWRQAVAILAVAAFSFVLTWLIAKAVDTVVGFSEKEECAAVPGEDDEHAYDIRTVTQLEPTADGRGLDKETLAQIQQLLRSHRDL